MPQEPQKVTDPSLLEQLNSNGNGTPQKVTDPSLLNELNGVKKKVSTLSNGSEDLLTPQEPLTPPLSSPTNQTDFSPSSLIHQFGGGQKGNEVGLLPKDLGQGEIAQPQDLLGADKKAFGDYMNVASQDVNIRRGMNMLQQNPNDEQGIVEIGKGYLNLGNDATAQKAFDDALALNPENVDALRGSAHLAGKKEDYKTALQFQKQAAQISNQLSDYRDVARLQLSANEAPDEALKTLDVVTQQNPEDYQAWQLKSMAENKLGETDKARESLFQSQLQWTAQISPVIDEILRAEELASISNRTFGEQVLDGLVNLRDRMGERQGAMLARALNVPQFISDNAETIYNGAKEMKEGVDKQSFNGFLQFTKGGADILLGLGMTTPAGYVFTQGIAQADVLTNDMASKIVMAPISTLFPVQNETGKRAIQILDLGASLIGLGAAHHALGGRKGVAETLKSAAEKLKEGKDLTGEEVIAATENNQQLATPETFQQLRDATEKIPPETPEQKVAPIATQIAIKDAADKTKQQLETEKAKLDENLRGSTEEKIQNAEEIKNTADQEIKRIADSKDKTEPIELPVEAERAEFAKLLVDENGEFTPEAKRIADEWIKNADPADIIAKSEEIRSRFLTGIKKYLSPDDVEKAKNLNRIQNDDNYSFQEQQNAKKELDKLTKDIPNSELYVRPEEYYEPSEWKKISNAVRRREANLESGIETNQTENIPPLVEEKQPIVEKSADVSVEAPTEITSDVKEGAPVKYEWRKNANGRYSVDKFENGNWQFEIQVRTKKSALDYIENKKAKSAPPKEGTPSILKEKIVDIEKRRREELLTFEEINIGGATGLRIGIKKINAKYDAEITAEKSEVPKDIADISKKGEDILRLNNGEDVSVKLSDKSDGGNYFEIKLNDKNGEEIGNASFMRNSANDNYTPLTVHITNEKYEGTNLLQKVYGFLKEKGAEIEGNKAKGSDAALARKRKAADLSKQKEGGTMPEKLRVGEAVTFKPHDKELASDVHGVVEDVDTANDLVFIRTPNGVIKTKVRNGDYVTHGDVLEKKGLNVQHDNATKTSTEFVATNQEVIQKIRNAFNAAKLKFDDIIFTGSFVKKNVSNDIDIIVKIPKSEIRGQQTTERYENAVANIRHEGLPINVIEASDVPTQNKEAYGKFISVATEESQHNYETIFKSQIKSESQKPPEAQIQKPILAEGEGNVNKGNISSQKEKHPLQKGVKTDIPYSDFTLHDENGIEFTKRIKTDEGGVSGVEPLNQFKLNQGNDRHGEPYPKVHIILDDADALKYQEGFIGADGKKKYKNNEFRNKFNEIAKKNRDKNDEVVLDFRKYEIENKKASEKTTQPTENKPLTEGEVSAGKEVPKSKFQLAKEKASESLKAANQYRKSRDTNIGVVKDPLKEAKKQAELDRKAFDDLVDVAREAVNEGIKNVADFAKALGEEVSDLVQKAWDVASNAVKYEDAVKEVESDVGISQRRTGITHAQTDEAARSLGLPEYEKNPETFAEWDTEAQKRIEAGEMPDLVKKLENGVMPDKVEQRMMAQYAADLLAKIEKNPSNELIDQYGEFKKLADVVGGREVAKSLAARQNTVPVMENVADMYLDKKEDFGVDVLTDAQKTEIQKQHDNYVKLRDEALVATKEANDAIAKLKAEQELRKTKATVPKVKRTHEDYVAERKVYIDSAREKLKKLRSGAQATFVPYANELVAIAPEVGKIMKSLLAEGIDKLDDVVKAIHKEFKGDIPELKEKDIHDIIAGEYNTEKPTRGALELKMRDLRDEAKYANKLAALLRGETPKTEKGRIERNQQIRDLQEKIKTFKKEQADYEKGIKESAEGAIEGSPDERALEAIIKRNRDAVIKIKDDLAKGKFEKNPRTPFTDRKELRAKYPRLWKKMMDSIAAKEDAQHEYEIGRIKDQMSKRSTGEKVLDIGKGVVATAKALRQGIDDSAIFVQNVRALLAHPISSAKALPAHIRDAFSEKQYTRWITDLHSNTFAWDLIEKSGLDITDPKSLRQRGREEPFSYNLLDKTFEVKGKKVNIGKHTIRPFERAFTSLGNHLRADAFLRMSEKFYKQGKTWETHPEEFKSLARALNNETGRGKIAEGLQGISKVIPIWSPRLLSSYINTLGLSDIAFAADLLKKSGQPKRGYYASMTPRMRAYAAASVAKHVGIVLSVMGLMSLYGWEPDLNPTSVTFGTVKKDGKSYNLFGGYSGLVKLVSQFLSGRVTRDGLTTKMKAEQRLALPAHFIRGKLTPIAASGLDVVIGRATTGKWVGVNYLGKEVSLQDEILQNVTPLSVEGIANGIRNEGLKSIFTTGIPSFTGLNVAYESDFQRQVPKEIKVGEKEVELTEPQQKEFQDSFDLKREAYVNKIINTPEYNKADDEGKASLQRMMINAAMDEAENELRGKYQEKFKETPEERKIRLDKKHERERLKKAIIPKKGSGGSEGKESSSESSKEQSTEKL